MTGRLSRLRARPWIAVVAVMAVSADCGGGGQRPPATPRVAPADTSIGTPSSAVQGLYESGRYREVLSSISAGTAGAEALWFAAHSSLRLGQREAAAQQFAQLPAVGASPAWQVMADLALALLQGDAEAIHRARGAAVAFSADPFVQFELGLAHASRNDFTAAAQAFDSVH